MEGLIQNWELGYSDSSDQIPAAFVPAHVPGSVQLDMGAALSLPDYRFGENVHQYHWMEDKFWWYRTEVTIEDRPGQIPMLVFESIDYAYTILFDGKEVYHAEGLYTPTRLDVSTWSGKTIRLEVRIDPSPKRPGAQKDFRSEASASVKPPFCYGWDWCPHLVSLGIWQDVRLDYLPSRHIDRFELFYSLNEALDEACIQVTYQQSVPGFLRFSLIDPAGQEVLSQAVEGDCEGTLRCTLPQPQLWWPVGYGAHPRYTAILSSSEETFTRPIGFRRVKLVMNEGAWADPVFPMSRADAPLTIEINGRRIFAKGSNWVPPSVFYPEITREVHQTLIDLALDTHMNILRIWGGGYVNSEDFFNLCDEKGMLVWQEFPLSCNNYPDTPEYLRVLNQESISIIHRLRTHPCLALWGGGNELFNAWSGMTDQSLPLRLLGRNCFDLDPYTPFIPTSPITGSAHGPYMPLDHLTNQEIVTLFYNSHRTGHGEFGCGAPSSCEYLKTCIPEEERNHPAPTGSWKLHHAFHSWVGEDTWFSKRQIEAFYGEADSLPQLIANGEQLQAHIYRQLFEELRMQWPHCSMAINWCYNVTWPTAAGNELLSYPAIPRPSYYAVQKALEPQRMALRLPRLIWKPGEDFSGELWILNDSDSSIETGRASVCLRTEFGDQLLIEADYPAVPVRENRNAFAVPLTIPASLGSCKLVLKNAAHPEWNTTYTLFIRDRLPTEVVSKT